jgi:hypothetical protein
VSMSRSGVPIERVKRALITLRSVVGMMRPSEVLLS